MLNDDNEDPGSKSIPWDEFFNEMDQKFTTTEDTVQAVDNQQEFFPNVATLPHKKAVCYGICTVSEQPKLVKCEDCGLVIKLVGFGHHRKVRHHDHPLVDEQSDNSAQSDSEDDCQGFLLSPPHHHCMAMPSTSESSNMESDESIRPVESNSSLPVTPVKTSSNLTYAHQQKPLYNIEKRNGLQIVLKRTPVKIMPEPGFEQQKSQNPNEPQQRPVQQAKKIKKKPIVHVFGSKKKRKGGKKKVAQPAMEVPKNEPNDILLEQHQPKHHLQAGAEHHPTTFLQEQYNNFVRREQIHSSSIARNPSTFERPTSQEPTNSPFPNWDPRDAAQRPVIGKGSGGGIGSTKPVGKVLPTLLYRRPAVATTISSSAIPAPHRTMQMPTTATSASLKRVSGPSILKYTTTTPMPNAADKPQQSHPQQQRQPVVRTSDTVFEQILKYPGISVTLKQGTGSATNTPNPIRKVMPTSSNQLHHHVVPHQNQLIQQQLAAMQHQQQKRRMMTRDFDAAKRDFEVTVNSRKSNNEEVRAESKPKPADNSAPASPDDSPAETTNKEEKNKIAEEVQQKQPKQIPLVPQDQAVQQEAKAQPKTTAPIQPFLRRIAEKEDAAEPGRNISPSSSGITWRRLAESPQLPGERKASSSGNSAPLRSPIITVGSTRFIPVDPRGLNMLRKNASSGNLLPQSATNSKSNSPATSSPLHSSNPQPSINERQQQVKDEQQPNSTGTSSASNTGVVSSASSTTSASSSPSNRQQQQHIEVVINNRKRPLDQQKQHMIIPMAKRYRPMLPKTAAGGSQQIGRFGMVASTDPSDQPGSSAVNIDAFSSMQPQQPQFSIIAPNSFPLGTNLVSINPQKLHQHYQQQQPQNRLQPQVKHQRYPSSTQELGQVFTIVQHQQQQQYRQQHHVLQQPQTHQQLRYHSNGSTISVNASHLLKVTPSGPPIQQQQQFHGGPSSSSMYQQQGVFPMGSPPPYEGGERIYTHQHYQVAPPDPAWEFVIGSSPPPNDYYGMQPQQQTMVSSSPYHNPHQMVQQQPYQTPYKPNMPMGYAQPQHPYAASGNQPAPMLPIQHQPQQQQFNAVGVRGYVTTTVNRLQPQQQQQTPAFLEPSPTYGGAVDFGGQMQGGGIKIYGNRMPPHQQQLGSGSNLLMGTIIADSSGIDPPPVLEAEGRFPVFSSATEQPTTSIRTRSAPTVEAAPNDEERSTSSGASDLDLREVLQQQQQGNTVTAASVQAQLNRQLKMRPT